MEKDIKNIYISVIKPRQTISDVGIPYCQAAWVDLQGQGVNNDYCRYCIELNLQYCIVLYWNLLYCPAVLLYYYASGGWESVGAGTLVVVAMTPGDTKAGGVVLLQDPHSSTVLLEDTQLLTQVWIQAMYIHQSWLPNVYKNI